VCIFFSKASSNLDLTLKATENCLDWVAEAPMILLRKVGLKEANILLIIYYT
jgi:hypothetical protein